MGGRPRVPVAPCKYCDRSFKRREHLERHLRTHTRERPFECGCGRMFSRQDLLTRHYRLSQCSNAINASESSRQDEGHLSVNVSAASPSSPLSSTGLSASSQQLDVSHRIDTAMLAPESEAGQVFNGNLNSTNYSRRQLRDRQPTRTPIIHTTEHSLGNVTASNQMPPVRAQHIDLDIAIQNSVDSLEAMQPETFPVDFLPNEPDMIDDYDYLRGVFSPTINQDLFMSDLRGYYELLPGMESSEAQNSLLLRTAATTPNQQPKQTPLAAATPSAAHLEQGPSDMMGQSPAQIRGSLDAIDDIAAANPWTISSSAYTRLQTEVNRYTDVLPQPFTLPSRQKLSRFIASWMRGYHPHLPFLHIPTASIDSMKPMLLLTLAATGSFYGFEHTEGYPMYFLAKAMIIKELERRRQRATLRLLRGLPQYAELPSHHSVSPSRDPSLYSPSQPVVFDLELLQALLVLIMTMSWLDGPFAEEALAMSSQLSALTREALSQPPLENEAGVSWANWGKEEERRRTIFASYFTLNIQTICFNVPPQLTNSEIKLPLPCSEAEFRAPTASSWHSIKRATNTDTEQRDYQKCLKRLLSGKPLNLAPTAVSEFGTYLLVQSLLMQIYFERQAVTPLLGPSQSLSSATIALYDKALSAWQACWDSGIESTLDPSTSPNGPLAFNSAAVLRLAHIHLGAGLQSHCELLTRDPEVAAQAFEPHRNPIPLRATHLTKTVFHAVCALRIPVRVGIAYVARGRTGHWSVQHAISNFTCALLLTHWLENMFHLVLAEGLEGLLSEERRLLSTIERLIEETHLESELGPKVVYPGRIRRLGIAALRLWAETCKGIQVYEIVHVVGETLSIAADTIERRL